MSERNNSLVQLTAKEPRLPASAGALLLPSLSKTGLRRFLEPIAELVDRIFGPVLNQLISNSVAQVQPCGIGKAERVAQNIGQFFGEPGAMRFDSRPLRGLGSVSPLEQLHEFGRFDRDRHGQVLGCMKLLPVPFGNELRHQPAQVSNCGGGIGHRKGATIFKRDRLSSRDKCQTGFCRHRQATFVGGGGSDRQRVDLDPADHVCKVEC